MKKALLIGINYIGQEEQLNGCINDSKNIQEMLIKHFNYDLQNIKLLNDNDTHNMPTKKNIEDNIAWLINNCKSGDTLIFYYSGHGSQLRDISGDETDKKDEVLVPSDFKKNGVIKDDWLYNNLIVKIPKDVSLWIFTDCCHSGTMVDLKYNYISDCKLKNGNIKKGMNYSTNEWTDKFNMSIERSNDIIGNICLLSGCKDSETSADAFIANINQGAFTFCLLEFINNNKNTLQKTKLRNALKEINCRLDINGFGQNTQLSLSKQADIERFFIL